METSEIHETSVIEEVKISELQIDRSYQRDISQSLVDQIAANWDEVASELILVSNRGDRPEGGDVKGGLWLVNGQHRTGAGRKLGHETIWARVVDLSSEEDPGAVEASLRLKTNVKLGDRPLERFKAQLRAHDEASMKIVSILAQFDTQINEVASKDFGINAVSTIESIYSVDEGALLYDTIALLKDIYDSLAGRKVSAAMMRAAAWFIERHAFETDRYRVMEKLKLIGEAALYQRAINHQSIRGGALWTNYYIAMLELYNEKMADRNKIEPRLRNAGSFGKTSTTSIRWGGGLG